MQMTDFYQEYGEDVVNTILDGSSEKTTHFVYAYVAKSIDYLIKDGDRFMVFSKGHWKPVVPFMVRSFIDIAYDINELREVAKSHAIRNLG